MATYKDRGVSAKKEDVHAAIKNTDRGLYPGAFCSLFPDTLTGSPDHCLLQHADGAGTKSSLAYLLYLETQDPSIFGSLAQDALVMNTDDALCVGAIGPYVLSNTIGRNAKKIPGPAIKAIIERYTELCDLFKSHGIDMISVGGETADVGDLVRSLIVDATITGRLRRSDVINTQAVKPGHIIIGLASDGQASYESQYNSGMGSNGLTLARHELLHPDYKAMTDSYAPEIADFAYTGQFKLSDPLPDTSITIGQALLSPTRTYVPVLKPLLDQYRTQISAIVHNTGGGQTKCLHFGKGIHYIKDNLFPLPPLFKLLKHHCNITAEEFYQTFNAGHRMEIYCDAQIGDVIIAQAKALNINAQQVGVVETHDGDGNKLSLSHEEDELTYTH